MPSHSPKAILAALRAEGLPAEPHNLGLAVHARDPEEYARALVKCGTASEQAHWAAQKQRLRVLTMGDKPRLAIVEAEPCTSDAYTCICDVHARERTQAVKRRRQPVAQPWEARARRAA